MRLTFFHIMETLVIILDSSMVEHSAVNRAVVGSSPTRGAHIFICVNRIYERPHGQAVKTSPFHGGNTSSNLVGVIYQRNLISN